MDLDNLGLFKLMSHKMGWLTQRQEVLAANVANADTPKYKPNDLKTFTFRDALGQSRRLEPAVTNASHLQGPRSDASGNTVERDRSAYDTTPSGNAVVLEDQMLKMSQSSTDYQTITTLYKKQLGLLRQAIGRGGS
jgi:flagellar basal-body rod protein FlgB